MDERGGVVQGHVKWFDDAKGYGFIKPDDGGKDMFVHFSEVIGEGHRTLVLDEEVEYEVGTNPKNGRPCAVGVRRVGAGATPAA